MDDSGLGQIDEAEASAGVRLLRAAAQTDGAASGDKRRAIRVVAGAAGIRASAGPSDGEGSPAIDVEAELARLRSPRLKALTLRAAFAIACLDDEQSPEGRRILDKVCAALDPKAGDPTTEAATWVPRMRAVRGSFERATDEFIRAVGRASSRDELSSETYTSLVLELDAQKLEVLRAVLLSTPPPAERCMRTT